MGTFTMALKEILATTDDIGLDEYPIFDAAYRVTLNAKIVDHYLNREIGQETVDMFTHAMRRKMNEIMPLYNQLYLSELLAIDPLLTFRSSSTSTATGTAEASTLGDSTATNSSESESKSNAFNSNYPQTRIVEDEQYADTGADSTANSTAGGTAETHDVGSQSSEQASSSSATSEGFSGAMSALLLEYRQTFLNIDMNIIDELEGLFMLLWDNGDAFTFNNGGSRW